MRDPNMRSHSSSGATIELFITRDWHVFIEVDGVVVPPLSLVEDSRQALEDKVRQARSEVERLEGLPVKLAAGEKLARYDQAVRTAGRLLGEVLFGTRRKNEVHHCLAGLYQRAKGSHVLISLCIEDMYVENLPWELALWRRGGRDVILGVDPRLALIRRMMARDFEIDPTGYTDLSPLKVLHISSTAGPGMASFSDHTMIVNLLRQASHSGDIQVRAITSEQEWWSEEPIHIFHYYGHGSQEALLPRLACEDVAPTSSEGVSAEVQLTPARVLQRLGESCRVPLLCVLLACKTFDLSGAGQRGQAWQFLQHGVEAAVGMIGSPHLGFGHYFLEMLYMTLPDKGLACAIQRVRREKYRYSARTMHGTTPDNDWFRPVLIVRNLQSLGAFAPLQHTRATKTREPDGELVAALRRGLYPSESTLSIQAQDAIDALERVKSAAEASNNEVATPRVDTDKLREDVAVHTPIAESLESCGGPQDLDMLKQDLSIAQYHLRWSAALQGVLSDAAIDAVAAQGHVTSVTRRN